MDGTKYAIVIDNGTAWFCYLVKYIINTEDYTVHEWFDIPFRVIHTDFCENIFSRPHDITDDLELSINNVRGFFGWHIGRKDYERVAELCRASKVVDRFEKLAKYGE